MGLTLKVKYFNTFVLREKPVKTIVTTTGRTTGTTVTIDSNRILFKNHLKGVPPNQHTKDCLIPRVTGLIL